MEVETSYDEHIKDAEFTNLAVLVSGTGSNLKAILEHGLEVRVVVADRECEACEIARKADIKVIILSRVFGDTFDRDAFTKKMVQVLLCNGIGLVVMAGFKTVLAKCMFDAANYEGKVLNIHPSLLPYFKGGNAVRDAYARSVNETGCTVHLATEEMDEGRVLAQGKVGRLHGDTEETLHRRIKKIEHWILPRVIETRQFLA